jgi:hypothetical protein
MDLRTLCITKPGHTQRIVDPTAIGGFMHMMNSAHNQLMCVKPTAEPDEEGQLQQYMTASKSTGPCEEMFWDYNATTDDPRDPMLKVKCFCCNKPLIRLVAHL